MALPDAAQRLVDNISLILERSKHAPRDLRKTQKGLAAAIHLEPATVNQTLARRGNTTFRLIHLDKIADYLGVTPSDLIRHTHSTLWELNPEETRLVRHWRAWPRDIQERVMSLFDFFAGMLPEEKDQRRWWQKIRRLSQQDRLYIERTIDDVLRARNTGPKTGADPAAPATGVGTISATPPQSRGRRK